MTVNLDLSTIAAGIITAAILALARTLAKSNRLLNQISDKIGTNNPPEGILGRVSKTEAELLELRDWAIRAGFDRRRVDTIVPS